MIDLAIFVLFDLTDIDISPILISIFSSIFGLIVICSCCYCCYWLCR